MLWLLPVALASQGVVIQVFDTNGLLESAPQLEVLDDLGGLHSAQTTDDGTPPDAAAGDGTWSGLVDQVSGREVILAVTDKTGRRWTGPFPLTQGRPTLRVVPTPEGNLRDWQRKTPRTSQGGVPPDSTWTAPEHRQQAPPPWALLIWLAGLGVGALALFFWADPGLATGPGGHLMRVRHDSERAFRRFLKERAEEGPLVIAGSVPRGIEAAVVLGPGRVDIDDLLLTLASLPGRPQLAVTGELEGAGGTRGEAALVQLADRLPGPVDAYVVGS